MSFKEHAYQPFNENAEKKKVTRRNFIKLLGLTGLALALKPEGPIEQPDPSAENDQENENDGEAFELALGNRALELEAAIDSEETTPEQKQLFKQEMAIINTVAGDLLKIKTLLQMAEAEEDQEKRAAIGEKAKNIADEIYALTQPQDQEMPTVQLKNATIKI